MLKLPADSTRQPCVSSDVYIRSRLREKSARMLDTPFRSFATGIKTMLYT